MNTPTKLTVVRICLVPVFVAVYLISAIPFGKFISLGIFIIASVTDWLDGFLARKYNQVTDLGKFLDPIADKLLVSAALILIILEKNNPYAWILAVLSIVIISRELVIGGFRTIAATKGVVLAADRLGKIKTVLQMIALILLIPVGDIISISEIAADIVFYVGFGFLCAATLMTIISGINYIVKNREVFK